jgi:predicted transcriptional regulator
MAIENEELQQLMEELRKSFGGLSDSTTGLTDAQKKLKSKIDSTMQAVGGVAKFGAAVGKGETDLKAFNGIIDTATGLVGSLAKTIPVFGDALAGLAKGVGEAAKMAVDALDNTAKSFVEIGKVGGLTAKGMSGVREQFMRSGLSLQSFQKQVVENSQALARFQGMTGAGADEFATMVGTLTKDTTGVGMELRRLGLNADEIAETTAAFVAQQTRLGRSQNMTQQQLTAGTVQYAKELDLLSKVTGLSRSAIQKQQDAALSQAKFRANYELAMQSGDAARIKGAEGMMTLQTRMESFGPELGQGIRDLSSGIANTDAAAKMLASTGGAAQDIMNRLKAGTIDPEQAQKELADAYGRMSKTQLQIASQVGDTIGVFSDTAQMQDFYNAAQKGQFAKAKAVQADQIKGNDKLTDETVAAQQNLEKMNQELNLLGFTLLPNASVVVREFTSVMAKAVTGINKVLGISSSSGAPAGAASSSSPSTADMITGGNEAQLTAKEQVAGSAKNGRSKLNIKSAESIAGGASSDSLIELAYNIQDALGGDLKYFSGLNDSRSKDGKSKHGSGQALDIVLNDPEKYSSVLSKIKGMSGVSLAQFEEGGQRNANGSVSSGAHIHAEISARNGFNGMISGPSSGYRPNLTMHGTESINIQPNPNTGSASPNSDSGIMQAQLSKLEELVTVMKSQLSVSNKLLSYSS